MTGGSNVGSKHDTMETLDTIDYSPDLIPKDQGMKIIIIYIHKVTVCLCVCC